MILEEKKLEKRFGKGNPYTVPEGYFDTLTSRIMSNLPDADQCKTISIMPTRKTYWKQWTCGVAACIAGALICLNVFDTPTQPANNFANNTNKTEMSAGYDEEYQKEVMRYAMVDYNDVYTYLSGTAY